MLDVDWNQKHSWKLKDPVKVLRQLRHSRYTKYKCMIPRFSHLTSFISHYSTVTLWLTERVALLYPPQNNWHATTMLCKIHGRHVKQNTDIFALAPCCEFLFHAGLRKPAKAAQAQLFKLARYLDKLSWTSVAIYVNTITLSSTRGYQVMLGFMERR